MNARQRRVARRARAASKTCEADRRLADRVLAELAALDRPVYQPPVPVPRIWLDMMMFGWPIVRNPRSIVLMSGI